MNLPHLTPSFPGIGGVIKQRPEDFFVQEIPLYEPSGEGEHVYAEIQKVGITTFEAVHRIAATLHVHEKDIGYAGLKDARAITRQVFSIVGVTEKAVMEMHAPGLTVQWAARHGNKLRLGHLSGNRFAIRIRNVNPSDVVKLQPVLALIQARGMPNYFGEQRFGRRGNNHLLGAALLRNDNIAVLKELLGTPRPGHDDPDSLRARAAFDARDNESAMRLYPRHAGLERRILARLIKTRKPNNTVRAIDEKLRKLWISALQSHLFNQTLARRIEALDRLLDGDLAYIHDSGACFAVESADIEQPRADRFEISPTGPLIGYRMSLPSGQPLESEQQILAEAGLTADTFRNSDCGRVKGARRPVRVKPTDIQLASGVDEFGAHITIAFSLPAGSYATVLLRELMKNTSATDDLALDSPTSSNASAPGGDERPHAEHDEHATENSHERLAADGDGIDLGLGETDRKPPASREESE
jgi:tRNA pseudouridine13 synthase